MNQFEKRMNALRRRYTAEQRQITKDAYRRIGHLNNAISQSTFPEVREVLRAEKERIYEAMRTSHEINRTCYLQQLELISDEQLRHHKAHPSNTQLRRMLSHLCESAGGQNPMTISFGENRRAEIIFS